MTHKCDYCDSTIKPCSNPCLEVKQNKEHICCKCNSSEACELPERVVCSKEVCNLKFTIDWYKRKFNESQSNESRLKEIVNEFRLINIGAENARRLIEEKDLDITGIKIFWSKRSLTWDNIPVEIGYEIMCLHEEGARRWAEWVNKKDLKVNIKKELIEDTEAKLRKAQKIRSGELDARGKEKTERQKKISLNDYEKIVLNYMKLGMTQQNAEITVKAMGMTGEARDLKVLNLT